jgi:hypothetical protein
MGLHFGFLPFFDVCHSAASLRSPFLSLGSLEIQETRETIDAFCAREKCPRFAAKRTLHSLFAERYQIEEYADLDLNNAASIKADLTRPIPDELRGKWKTIYDGGTSEHVFDVAAAFEGMHDLCCPKEGVILHIAPITWLFHGYYNLTPHLFESIARVNKYRILAAGYYFMNSPAPRHVGFWKRRESPVNKGLVLTEVDGKKTSHCDRMEQLFSADRLPNNALFCIGFQKQEDRAFVRPYDIRS